MRSDLLRVDAVQHRLDDGLVVASSISIERSWCSPISLASIGADLLPRLAQGRQVGFRGHLRRSSAMRLSSSWQISESGACRRCRRCLSACGQALHVVESVCDARSSAVAHDLLGLGEEFDEAVLVARDVLEELQQVRLVAVRRISLRSRSVMSVKITRTLLDRLVGLADRLVLHRVGVGAVLQTGAAAARAPPRRGSMPSPTPSMASVEPLGEGGVAHPSHVADGLSVDGRAEPSITTLRALAREASLQVDRNEAALHVVQDQAHVALLLADAWRCAPRRSSPGRSRCRRTRAR